MYVDPGAAQALIRQLNRWYRQRAKPRGTVDHFYRGTRMTYTAVYRRVICFFCLILLTVAALLYFVPATRADNSPLLILAWKIVAFAVLGLAVILLLHAFREFTVVTDDGLVKSNLFGRETRLGWREISSFQIKADDNRVVLLTAAKAKLTLSLSYDGWQDFRESAEKHMEPGLYWQFYYALANLNARPAARSTPKKLRLPKWFSFGRKH